MKEKILAILAKLGLTADQTALIADDLKNLPVDVPTPPKTEVPPPTGGNQVAMDAAIKAAVEAAIAPLQKALADEVAEKKVAADLAKQQAAEKRTADIKALLDDAVAKGKIPADNTAKRQAWEQQFAASFDTAKFALEQIVPAVAPGVNGKPPAGSKAGADGKVIAPRTGLAAGIRNDRIAEYVAQIPIASTTN